MLALLNGEYISVSQDEKTIEATLPYEEEVARMIRERYSIDDELAIQRQRDTKPQEFWEYFNYCEACKAKAK